MNPGMLWYVRFSRYMSIDSGHYLDESVTIAPHSLLLKEGVFLVRNLLVFMKKILYVHMRLQSRCAAQNKSEQDEV